MEGSFIRTESSSSCGRRQPSSEVKGEGFGQEGGGGVVRDGPLRKVTKKNIQRYAT